ncbi:MAG TPA: hypothetical protein VEJ42_08520 [Streptosporangiaceae bacterium]|nr:hypothetical protein [Streptosporangiaceae bacterium]
MAWLWISAPIAAVFFLGYTVIPLWLVFRRPDVGPAEPARPASAPSPAPHRQLETVRR